jgi:hypothetical protein
MDVLTRTRVAAAAALLIAALSPAGSAAPPATLGVPDRISANVSLASRGPFVAAVWSASASSGETDIYAAVSRDAGETFGVPARVNSTPGQAQVNGEQPPRVALAGAGAVPEIVVVWTAKTGADTVLLTAASSNGGRTFSASSAVSGSEAPGNRGWQAIATDGSRPFVVWLDHRELVEQSGGHQHGQTTAAASVDGVAMAQRSRLFFASLDGAVPPAPVTGGVCYCCKTAAAVGANGTVFLAWRHVYPGNLRDIAFAASRNGGRSFTAPIRVSEDQWAINGCPDDGPAMAIDDRGAVHVVWPTVVTENGGPIKALFHAVSSDGRTFGARTRLPTRGQANHPQVAVGGGRLTVVWDESGDGSRRIAAAHADLSAGTQLRFARADLDVTPGVYPAVVATPSGPLLVWTSGATAESTLRLARLH